VKDQGICNRVCTRISEMTGFLLYEGSLSLRQFVGAATAMSTPVMRLHFDYPIDAKCEISDCGATVLFDLLKMLGDGPIPPADVIIKDSRNFASGDFSIFFQPIQKA
jgi:hypothetical protein